VTMMVRPDNIPEALKERDQWIVWREETRSGEPTKVPYSTSGKLAKSNDPETWTVFQDAVGVYRAGGYSGIGFVFSAGDPFVGVDLDGCRDPLTHAVSDWAKEVIDKLDTYAEVSPSGTGIKLFCRGVNPLGGGRKVAIKAAGVQGKNPAVEVYSEGRYFAVTGYRGRGPKEPEERNEQLAWLKAKYFEAAPTEFKTDFYAPTAVVERAIKYLAKMPPAVSGQGGHNRCFHAACILVLGFGLSIDEAFAAIQEWNGRCDPPWSERELRHKLESADKQTGDRNFLRNVPLQRQDSVSIPTYAAPQAAIDPPPERATLVVGATEFIERLRAGEMRTIPTGIRDIDDSMGGIGPGEIIILAGRPGHGKSAVALQFVHHWTKRGESCVIISEEMSRHLLGKRTLQFITDLPEDQWEHCADDLERELAEYSTGRAPCYVAERCGTADAAIAEIERAAADGATFALVDYAQLLQAPGKTQTEVASNVCKMLVRCARRLKITLVMLCQLNRGIENRDQFIPRMKDLKESGQFEQDADVIFGVVWPWKLNPEKQAREDYQVFVMKNRNRDTRQPVIACKFDGAHQRIAQSESECITSGKIAAAGGYSATDF
jgi:KaiC/GvpD/RAD55 family RecA-like ATPase